MLEFYPMPTNLNHANGLYPHHQNHGGARFLDNPATATGSAVSAVLTPTPSPHSNNNNSNNSNNNSNIGQMLQHHAGNINAGAIMSNNNNNNNSTIGSSPATDLQTCTSSTTTPSSMSTLTLSLSATLGPMGLCDMPNSGSATPTSTNRPANTSSTASSASSSSSSSTSSSMSMSMSSSSSTASSSVTSCANTLSTTTSTTTATTSPPSATASATGSTASTCTATAAATIYTSPSLASAMSMAATTTSKLSAECNGRTDVGHIKCEKNFEICEGCGQKIHDRYLMNVGDANWHEQCLACCYCGMQLHNTCYVRNTKLYCKLDYDRLFGIKCTACCHPVLPHDMVMRPIPNYIFHLACFVCYACRSPLQKGEQFMLRDGQLFCFRHDLEKEMYLAAAAAAQHCGFVGLDDEDLLRPRDGRRGPKRPRTILTSQQRKQFKASFDQSPKPCRKVREALAKDTGLSVRVVQVWFQNQRAKMKKIQRKAKNGGGGPGGSGTGRAGSGSGATTNSADNDKDMASVGGKEGKDTGDKCHGDTVMGGTGGDSSYLSLDSAFGGHHQPLNPNLPFSPDDYPANSNDSFCSSDLSLDGSNFDQLDDDTDSLSLNNLELQSTSSSGNHHHHHHHHHSHSHHSNPHDMIANLNNSLINPIDKLYLMQNSYFNSEQ